MDKINERLERIASENRIGLMTHLVIGYPDLATNLASIKVMAEAGVDFIELQIPFSDPVADGPTIMRANESALALGTSLDDCFQLMQQAARSVDIPLLFMSYYNPVFRYGTEQFVKQARKSGASGLLIPDMPVDEETNERLFQLCLDQDMLNICFTSPATTSERMQQIKKYARSFVYCFSTYGVTGARDDLDQNLAAYLSRVRSEIELPLGVGFGIKNRQHVRKLADIADIAIIGSAIIDLYQNNANKDLIAIKRFIEQLRQ